MLYLLVCLEFMLIYVITCLFMWCVLCKDPGLILQDTTVVTIAAGAGATVEAAAAAADPDTDPTHQIATTVPDTRDQRRLGVTLRRLRLVHGLTLSLLTWNDR